MGYTGSGATITFGTSGFAARFRQIGGLAEEVPVLDDTVLASTNYMEKVPGDLADLDGIDLELYYDQNANPALPPLGVPETVTLTYPAKPGSSNGGTRVGSAFFSRRESPTLTPNERMVATVRLQYDGKTEPVIVPGS